MRPDFAIIEEKKSDGFTVLSIDTKKASYQGILWRTLGDFGKRKFSNLLVMDRPKERLKLIYI